MTPAPNSPPYSFSVDVGEGFMRLATTPLLDAVLGFAFAQSAQSPAQRIDLAERLSAGTLRGGNRQVTKLQGSGDGVHLSEKPDVGIAFHGKNDSTYESVYVRPFNFRASSGWSPT